MVFKPKRSRRWIKIALYVVVIGGGVMWQLRNAFPPPACTAETAAGYSGEEMYDFGMKRRVLWTKDLAEATCWYERSAEAGYANAASAAGRSHEQGRGVPVDVTTAVMWYEKATEMGNSGGAFMLGKLYDNGALVPRDATRALTYFKQAARMGNSGAIKYLNDAGIEWRAKD